MNERFVTGAATGLTAVLVIFILGFSLGRTPTEDGMLLVSSQSAMESSAIVNSEPESSAAEQPSSALSESSQDESGVFPVDLNTADATLLDTVPGIGDVIAGRIIEYRNSVGKFKTVDELLNVKGIGEKTLEEMRDYLTVSE